MFDKAWISLKSNDSDSVCLLQHLHKSQQMPPWQETVNKGGTVPNLGSEGIPH